MGLGSPMDTRDTCVHLRNIPGWPRPSSLSCLFSENFKNVLLLGAALLQVSFSWARGFLLRVPACIKCVAKMTDYRHVILVSL